MRPPPERSWEIFEHPVVFERSVDDAEKLTGQRDDGSAGATPGWANYFCLGSVSKAYSAVDLHARRRLRRWLCDKTP